MQPLMIVIAATSGIALGTLVLAVIVTFRSSAVFPVLLGGLFLLMLLIGIDYWQWIHRDA